MRELADGVWRLGALLPGVINIYVVRTPDGDVLIDAGTRWATGRVLRELRGRRLAMVALTHAHPDHQGASHEVCEKLGIPLWCGEADADAAERPELIKERQPDHFVARLFCNVFAGPGHPVARRLREGDEMAGFTVLDVPGHSAGHVAYWRESDRALVLGDVLNSMDVLTAIPGLREPKPYLTPDPARNRESARRLAALEPAVVCFGHGPPVRDTQKFVDFVATLPA